MKKFKIQRGKAKKGEGRSLKEGGRDLGNEEFVIWYVKNVLIFAENSEMYIPKCIIIIWYVNSLKYTKSL